MSDIGSGLGVSMLHTQTQLRKQREKLEEASERLASGKRINSAKDDPAGSAIATNLTSQIKELEQTSRNQANSISAAEIQDTSLQNSTDNIGRIRELVVASANSSNSVEDNQAIQSEITQLVEATGNSGELKLDQVNVTSGNTDDNLELLDDAQGDINSQRATIGAQVNGLESAQAQVDSSLVNQSAARSRVLDTDILEAISDQIKAETQQKAAIEARRREDERLNNPFGQ